MNTVPSRVSTVSMLPSSSILSMLSWRSRSFCASRTEEGGGREDGGGWKREGGGCLENGGGGGAGVGGGVRTGGERGRPPLLRITLPASLLLLILSAWGPSKSLIASSSLAWTR